MTEAGNSGEFKVSRKSGAPQSRRLPDFPGDGLLTVRRSEREKLRGGAESSK